MAKTFTFTDNHYFDGVIKFYDDGEVEVEEWTCREGGVVRRRDVEDILNRRKRDKEFIDWLCGYSKNKMSETKYGELRKYMSTLKWVKDALEASSDTVGLEETVGLVNVEYVIYNRINYNDWKSQETCNTIAEAMKSLAYKSNWRPNGKTPILGSGTIKRITTYADYEGKVAKYEETVFKSYGNNIGEPLDEWEKKKKLIRN